MKALVINTTRMGDLIQSTPLMQALQSKGYEVTLLYSDGFEGIATMLAGVDRLVPFSLVEAVNPLLLQGNNFLNSYKFLSKLLTGLREESFDLVLNATHSAYSALVTAIIAGKDVSSGLTSDCRGKQLNCNEWGRYYLTSQSCRESNRFNLVDIHRMMAGVPKAFPVRLDIPPSTHIKADELLGELKSGNAKLIGIVPGASTAEKTLPVESFAAVIELLKETLPVEVVIFGAKSESIVAENLAKLLPESLNLCGKTDVATLAALISRCDLLISNDTGPMHVAAAVGTTVVEISLGSALASETAPYGEGHYVIESRALCHPCLPRMHCTHFSCGKNIPPRIISLVALEALGALRQEGKSLKRFRDEANQSGVDIYRTSFDQDGFQQLVPLIDKPLTANDILYDAMKEVWKEALGVASKDEANCFSGQSNLSVQVVSALNSALQGFSRVAEIAGIGARSCEELVVLAENPAQLETMKKLAGAVQNIDRGLAQIAYAMPVAMPFLTQFTSAKESIRSATLSDHAKKTAVLFRNLENWCNSLISRVDSIINDSVQETVDAA